MDEEGRKTEPSLPADYVSLAQLQERWLKKQQEKKLKEKQEEEKKQIELRTQNEKKAQTGVRNDGRKQSELRTQNENKNRRGVRNDEKIEGGSVIIRNVPPRRMEKYGGEMGVIEGKGKGKEIVNGGVENVEKNRNKSKKKKKTGYGRKGNGSGVEKARSEIDGGFDGGEIISRDEAKLGISRFSSGENGGKEGNSGGLEGVEETASVNMVEVLPENGVVKGDSANVRKMGFRGGFRRNGDNRGSGGSVYMGRREYVVKKVNEVKETELKLGSTEKMEDGKGYGDKVELKGEDEKLEAVGEIDGSKGGDRNGFLWKIKNMRNKINQPRIGGGEGSNDNRVVGVELKKVEDEVLVVDNGKNGEKRGEDNEVRRNRGKIKNRRNKINQPRNGGGEGSNDNGVVLESKKVEDEVLVVENGKDGKKRGEDNELRRNKGSKKFHKRRNKINQHRIVGGEGLNDNKVEDEVIVEESGKNGEKRGEENELMRSGNVGSKFEGLSLNDGKAGDVRPRVRTVIRIEGRGRFGSYGGFGDRRKMKERDGGMVWVKKEEKSSGTMVDRE